MNNWELSYQKRTILKYFVEGKVKENFKKGYFSNILVLTSLSYIIEITKETFIFETFFHFSPNKNFHFKFYLMNTIQITRYIEWISLFFFYSSFWSLPASRGLQKPRSFGQLYSHNFHHFPHHYVPHCSHYLLQQYFFFIFGSFFVQ